MSMIGASSLSLSLSTTTTAAAERRAARGGGAAAPPPAPAAEVVGSPTASRLNFLASFAKAFKSIDPFTFAFFIARSMSSFAVAIVASRHFPSGVPAMMCFPLA